jgi:hypothetical protein
MKARWVSLKHRPYQDVIRDPRSGKKVLTTGYEQHGRVVQAEEVRRDGKWRRYYGFVGANQVAQVPADEIEFPPGDHRASDEARDWVAIGPGSHVRLTVPPLPVELFEDLPPRLAADAGLVFAVTFRNSHGLARPTPAPGPALRMRVLYSPEVVSPQGALAPKAVRQSEWVEMAARADTIFQAEPGKTLVPTEETRLATVDLCRAFDVERPGFYRVQLWPAADRVEGVPVTPAEVRFSLVPRVRNVGGNK